MPKTKLRKKIQFKDLRMIRIFDFNLIPKDLFKQVKGRNWDINMLFQLGAQITANPFTHLYVFANKDNIIKGFMWGSVNPMTKLLGMHVLSVDKEYWGSGILAVIKKIIHNMIKDLKLKGCAFETRTPKAFERAGYKRSDMVSMTV